MFNCSIIGKKVSEFNLEVFHKEEIKKIEISDYKGKWLVLFFYPADFTFVCPTELKNITELYEDFQKNDAEVISISTDSVFVHKVWHENSPVVKKVEFPMAADPAGNFARTMGVLNEDEGVAYRATFIIDPGGTIRAFEINDNNFGRSAKEILRKLQAAVYVRNNPGELCPGNWVPGGKTLSMDTTLIGKI